jgi:hypothetical protein
MSGAPPDARLLSQNLSVCTSKASKLSTGRDWPCRRFQYSLFIKADVLSSTRVRQYLYFGTSKASKSSTFRPPDSTC